MVFGLNPRNPNLNPNRHCTVQMKEAVNEEHEGRRKNELTWKINRIHWEKNRFIYDLMYQRKVCMSLGVGPSNGGPPMDRSSC